MADIGFSIRCPECGHWDVRESVDVSSIALTSPEELQEIMRGFHKDPEGFRSDRLLRCQRPRSVCPASFEAFICRSQEHAMRCMHLGGPSAFKRAFRLYKADRRERWEGKYYGVLFRTYPVQRPSHFELDLLIDRQLLRRLVRGISQEIKLPLTLYVGTIFEPVDQPPRAYWMPLEAYTERKGLVPRRYNAFCRECRSLVMKGLKKEFGTRRVGPDNCRLGFWTPEHGTCAGRPAACLEVPPDWNHCPVFIEERMIRCPCCNSDYELIGEIEKRWRRGKTVANGVKRKCWAKFTEIGFPIFVHDHLIGVAMTGQMFLDPREIGRASEIASGCGFLAGHENNLQAKVESLTRRGKKPSPFQVTRAELQQRIERLCSSIEELRGVADGQYRDFRARSEVAFCQELIATVQVHREDPQFFETRTVPLIRRMCEFWAFKAGYMLHYSRSTTEISIIAFSSVNREKGFGLPGQVLRRTCIDEPDRHPTRYLHRRGDYPPQGSTLLGKLLPLFEEAASMPALDVPDDEYAFFVILPFMQDVYAFVFVGRDDRNVCALPCWQRGSVSVLAQDTILATCEGLIYRLGDLRVFAEMQQATLRVFGHELYQETDILARQAHADLAPERIRDKSPEDLLRLRRDLLGCLERLSFLGMQTRLLSPVELPFTPAPFSVLERLLEKWLHVYALEADYKHLKIIVESPQPPEANQVKVYGDPTLLAQVMYNLVTNALKFCHAGTKIYLRCEPAADETGPGYRLSVTDYGMVFDGQERFSQLYGRGDNAVGLPGLGLGLYIASRAVERHGQKLRPTSRRISRYNVPLIEAYLREVRTRRNGRLRRALLKERARLKDNGVFDRVVSSESDRDAVRAPQTRHELERFVSEETHEVSLSFFLPNQESHDDHPDA